MPTTSRRLPRTVLWLGLVSLLTDASSDMIYPLMPLFLTSVLGAGPLFVGLLEGAAEAVASLLKLASGAISDKTRTRKPLAVAGYAISSTVRPLVGLASATWMVLVVRLLDRVGKGVRSSPRDALLADVTPPDRRGRAFGFHRAMDNAGAVLGPAIATLLLAGFGLSLRTIFLCAAIPGALAMAALVFGVKEPPRPAPTSPPAEPVLPAEPSPGVTPPGLAPYLVALALFALGNASDAFLLLRARELGVPQAWIPTLWLVHNAVKALLSTAGGALSDRVGRKRVIIGGWLLYGGCYLAFGLARSAWQVWALFVVYGVYYALVEGSEKALIADLVPARFRGRAFGYYHAVIGLCALPASLGFGLLARLFGAQVPFTVAAVLAMLASGVVAMVVQEPRRA